jgi:magnesium-transporting ATPase (P-type)
MGVSPVFCCFNNQQPKCVTATGLVASILAFAFLTWGVADLEFKRDGVKAIYIIAYILVIVILLTFIFLFILLSMQKSNSYRTMMNLGRLICLLVLVFTGIAFIFLLIAWIILLVDYSKLHSFLKDLRNGEVADDEDPDDYDWAEPLDDIDIEAKIIGHEWAAVIVPGIIGLITLIVIALVLNYLYKVFKDYFDSATEYPVTDNNQNTVGVATPNTNQPGLFPNNNRQCPDYSSFRE